MKTIRMLRNHRELVVRQDYSVPEDLTFARARALVENGFAEEIEMAVAEEREKAVSPRGKKVARRKRSPKQG